MQELNHSLIADLPPFQNLTGEELRSVLSKARKQHVLRGDAVFSEGANATHFFLLLDGHVQVERLTPDGDRVIPMFVPPGQLIGIAAALSKDLYPATAVAATDCLLLKWPMRLWSDFSESYAGFAAATYRVVGTRLDEVNRRVMELATQRVEQRVANALLSMSRNSARQTDDGMQIEFPLTRRQISEMTGSTLHTVSRLLSLWETEGVLTSRKKHITIRDTAGLQKLASPSE